VAWRAAARLYGTTPVPELLAWLDEQKARAARDPNLRQFRGRALAMLGRFDEARALHAELRTELAERGGGILLGILTGLDSVDSRCSGYAASSAPEHERAGLRRRALPVGRVVAS
jgi:hypothetical protein